MSISYQQQRVLDGLAARGAILNLTARHNRAYSTGDAPAWLSTFRHSGAVYRRGGGTFTDITAAFDGGEGQRLVTLDHDIDVDGVEATQRCVALLFRDGALYATGHYADTLVYERGGWYFASRQLDWDHAPRADALPR